MQQAYQALRVISEAQTIHIVLDARPGALTLRELHSACVGLHATGDNGIKAVILDFAGSSAASGGVEHIPLELLAQVRQAVSSIPQPVLAVARADLSAIAVQLMAKADFTLVAHEAGLYLPPGGSKDAQGNEDNRIGGLAAERLGYATWTASAENLDRELERILNLLRNKSALALRHAKASVHRAGAQSLAPLEALRQVNQFYLENVTQTEDAREGLQAFLEKRQPRWKNR
jgi:Enoyl-CoA hydratase/isomerase